MPDPANPHGKREAPKMKPEDKWIVAFFAILFGGLIIVEMTTDYVPSKISFLVVPLVWIPLVVLHELGHAVMAKICGWKVEKYVIGFGRAFSQFKVGNTKVELRVVPVEGFVVSRPHPKKLSFKRLKLSLIYAAGPGIELLLFVGILAWFGTDRLLDPDGNIPAVIAQAVCLAIGIGVIINLIPISPSGILSDGQGIVMSWIVPDDWFVIWSRGEEIDFDAPVSERPRVRRPPEST